MRFTMQWRVAPERFVPLLAVLTMLAAGHLRAQSPSRPSSDLRGTISDSTTGEILVGATVLLVGTQNGAATDLDGGFLLRRVPHGTHELRVSMVGYATKIIRGVKVGGGDVPPLHVVLVSADLMVDEVVITADAVRSTEAALLTQRKKAGAIGDGMSGEQIRRTPDANTADVIRRIPSVTIVDNKFLQVRGSSERYNGAMLNNASLSSTEPEKKAFAFDLIPSNLIENTILTKSFTPDLPGDFSGGLLQINTVDFPPGFTLNLGAGGSYATTTTNEPFLGYYGGGMTYGPDAGIRGLPASFPSSLSRLTLAQKQEAAKSLLNVWGPQSGTAPFNGNYSLGAGSRFDVLGQTVGVVVSAVNRSTYEQADIERNDYESTGETRFNFVGSQSRHTVVSGGVANAGVKLFDRHKIAFRNTLTRSADDEVIVLEGADNDAGFYQRQTALRYVSREVVSNQLLGSHNLPWLSGIEAEWRLFRSNSHRNEPDYRRVYYARDIGAPDDPFFAVLGPQVNLKNGGRYYSDLSDDVRGGGVDIATPVLGAKIKAGALFEEKRRNFSSRLIGILANAPGNGFTDFALLYLPIDSIFAPENFRRNGFSIDEYVNGTNRYFAAQTVRAGYAMADWQILPLDLRVIAGARLERSTQAIRTRDLTDTRPIDVERSTVDILPSVNLVYSPWAAGNLRAAYSQTINRPELRELAPFSYYDFSTQYSLTGNPDLGRTLIRNYDLRAEFFPGIGEVLSVSLFYKALSDAIEQVVKPSAALGSERTFLNAPAARNYGIEFEARKNLAFLWEALSGVSVNLNYSIIRSKVEFATGVSGVEVRTRPLQGQSDYVVNAGLSWTEPSLGTTLSLLYNRFGDRITEVSTSLEPDVIEQGRNVVDFVVSQDLGSYIDLRLAVRDLLREPQVHSQGDLVARRNSRGMSVSLGTSVKF